MMPAKSHIKHRLFITNVSNTGRDNVIVASLSPYDLISSIILVHCGS